MTESNNNPYKATHEYAKGETTIEEAAAAAGWSVHKIKHRVRVLSPSELYMLARLPNPIPYDKYQHVIERLCENHSRSQVHVFLAPFVKERKPTFKDILARRHAAREKWETHRDAALALIAGSYDVAAAAEEAGISPRQILRWQAKLLALMDVSALDLRAMEPAKRARLSGEISRKMPPIRHALWDELPIEQRKIRKT